MKKYSHGGDVYSDKNRKIIYDFSANINPLGLPKEVKTKLSKMVGGEFDFTKYPDALCGELTDAISDFEQVDKEYIICGNGAADIIYRLCLWNKPKKAMVIAPCFSEYEKAVRLAGGDIEVYQLEKKNFELDKGILKKIEECFNNIGEVATNNKDSNIKKNTDRIDLQFKFDNIVFLCNPSNPVGNLIGRQLLLDIMKLCQNLNILLVVDECFLSLVQDGDKLSLINEVKNNDRLFILKAFTKSFAMAGFRLGYGISSNLEMIDGIFNLMQPWSVSSLAQQCGILTLKQKGFLNKSIEFITDEREKLKTALLDKGYKLFGSKANYIFFKVLENNNFFEKMREKGILVRSCSNYRGLDESYFRIAVRSEKENNYFIKVLEDI